METPTEDEIVALLPALSNSILNKLGYIEERIKTIDGCFNKYLKIIQSQTITNDDYNKVVQNNFLNVHNQNEKNCQYLEYIKDDTEKLAELRKGLKKSVTEDEETMKTLKLKISKLHVKKKSLQEKREKILVFKLITNTEFGYQDASITGYTIGYASKNIKSFDLNHEECSQKKITDTLYDLVKKTCLEDTQSAPKHESSPL